MCHLQTWYPRAAPKKKVMVEKNIPKADSATELQTRLFALSKRGSAKGKQQEVPLLLSHMI